eukprot:Clim_evm23s191 gene=Clim_evmTU23s191
MLSVVKSVRNVVRTPGTVRMATMRLSQATYATQRDNVIVEQREVSNGKYAVLKLNRAPVNSFDHNMVKTVMATMDEIEADKSIRGVVYTSAIPGQFSAGIDLAQMSCSEEEWRAYWADLRQMFFKLYESKKSTACIITGAAPGLGAVMALGCSHRFMLTGRPTFGLNEVAVGLPVPYWLCELFAEVAGSRAAETMLPVAKMVPAEEALKLGMVDGIATNYDLALKQAEAVFTSEFSFPQQAQADTRSFIRGPQIKRWKSEESMKKDTDIIWGYIGNPKFQEFIKQVQANLKAKASKAKAAKAAKA